MDFRNILEQAAEFVGYVATTNPYAVPFWAAIAWIILLLNWQRTMRLIWRSLHLIEDLVLQRELFAKIQKPLRLLLLLMALLPFLHFVPNPAGTVLARICGLTVPLLLLYVLVQFIDTILFTWYLTQRKEANVPAVLRFVVLCGVYVVFGMAFMEWVLGVNLLPLLATSTVLTAVFGFALQDTLKNLFAGLTMSFEKRFREGDWIMFRLDATNTTIGEVIEIGWRSTKIRTIDNNFSVIPNGMFTSNQLVNYSQPTPEFPKAVEIPVRMSAPLDKVRECLTDAALSTGRVLQDPVPEVVLLAVRTDHMVYRLRFWVATYAQSDSIASDVLESAHKKLSALAAIPAVGELPSTRIY